MTASTSRRTANRAFALRTVAAWILYAVGLGIAVAVDGTGFPAWIPALLVIPAVILLALANIGMYRSGDEFQQRKIAEAVMVAFVVSTGLILAVGVLQFFLIPDLNWIFAFSLLMLAWIVGTVVSAVRYR